MTSLELLDQTREEIRLERIARRRMTRANNIYKLLGDMNGNR